MRYLFAGFLVLVLAATARAAVQEPVCIQCHDSDTMKPAFRPIPGEWRKSWHYQNGVACNDCHGGDAKDAAMAMSPGRGFVGAPRFPEVPAFCGKCHIGILKNYTESGHGKALKASGRGPNCVTCHGSHNVQKANIDIINEQRCSRCHTYDRARAMKTALFGTEERILNIRKDLRKLASEGFYTADEEKELFRTEVAYRTLFHTVDVPLVKEKTGSFDKELDGIQKKADSLFAELGRRRNYSGLLMLLLTVAGIVAFLVAKTYR